MAIIFQLFVAGFMFVALWFSVFAILRGNTYDKDHAIILSWVFIALHMVDAFLTSRVWP